MQTGLASTHHSFANLGQDRKTKRSEEKQRTKLGRRGNSLQVFFTRMMYLSHIADWAELGHLQGPPWREHQDLDRKLEWCPHSNIGNQFYILPLKKRHQVHNDLLRSWALVHQSYALTLSPTLRQSIKLGLSKSIPWWLIYTTRSPLGFPCKTSGAQRHSLEIAMWNGDNSLHLLFAGHPDRFRHLGAFGWINQ